MALIEVVPQSNQVETAVSKALSQLQAAGKLKSAERMAKARGYKSLEHLMRAQAHEKMGLEVAQGLGKVQPGSFAAGGPLGTSTPFGGAGSSLPVAAPGGPSALPAAGQSAGTRMGALQRLEAAALGNASPTRATQMLPAVAPSTAATQAASMADDALVARLGSVTPGAYSAGGPMALLNKTPGWQNGLNLGAPPPALPAAPALPTAATRAASAAAGSVGMAPISMAGPPLAAMPGASAAPVIGSTPFGPAAPSGFAASRLGSALLPKSGAGVLGGLGKARFGLQAGTGLMVGGTAGSLVDKANVGGSNSILDQFTTGAAAGGIAGGIAGAGTGPGALLSAGAGALIGGVGNVLGNQTGLWGAKKNPGANTDTMDLAVSKLMNAFDNAGLAGDIPQELIRAVRAQAPLYSGKGGKTQLNADVDSLIAQLPALAQQQSTERQRMAYDNTFRNNAIAQMQPRLEQMKRQYNNLADLYERNGDPIFAQSLRTYADQHAAETIASIQQIPQQVALERARSFAAQLDQARQSVLIGQMVGGTGASSGGLEALAAG